MKRSKYRAVPTVVDGIRFASKREAARYGELRLLERTGKIADLELQPKIEIWIRDARNRTVTIAMYVADFRYFDGAGEIVIEDVKGVRTPLYRLKKKLVEALYGITITEV